MNGDNRVICPHGIECDYVYRKTTIQGEEYVTGGDYWHDPETRCTAVEDLARLKGDPDDE